MNNTRFRRLVPEEVGGYPLQINDEGTILFILDEKAYCNYDRYPGLQFIVNLKHIEIENEFYDWRNNFMAPSRLDNYAQYLTGNLHNYPDRDGWIPPYTDELFVESLLVKKSTVNMEVGTSLHKVLELGGYRTLPNKFTIDGYNIEVEPDIEIQIPEVRESWIYKQYKDMIIRGKVDAVSAVTIHDYKFTSKISLEKYIESNQWKIYLWATGKDKFVYDLFEIWIDKKSQTSVVIKQYVRLPLERYATLDQEVENLYDSYWQTLENFKPLIMKGAKERNVLIRGL